MAAPIISLGHCHCGALVRHRKNNHPTLDCSTTCRSRRRWRENPERHTRYVEGRRARRREIAMRRFIEGALEIRKRECVA